MSSAAIGARLLQAMPPTMASRVMTDRFILEVGVRIGNLVRLLCSFAFSSTPIRA
jgi:hypothetical protein